MIALPGTVEAKRGCTTSSCKQRVAEKHWRHLQWKLPPETKAMLARLRHCESTSNYRANTGNGYHGAYQYMPGTARRAGFKVRADRASPAEQDVRTARFYPAHRNEWACRA